MGLFGNFHCPPAAGQNAEIEIVMVSDPSALVPIDVSAVALDFKVLHPVVITRLGVFPSGMQSEPQRNVTVKLLQLDQEVIELGPVSVMKLVCCFFSLLDTSHSLGAAGGLGAVCVYSLGYRFKTAPLSDNGL